MVNRWKQGGTKPNASWRVILLKRESFYQRHEGLILGGGAVIVAMAIWEFIWKQGWVSPLFFSGPSAIAAEFWTQWTEGTLPSDILFSGCLLYTSPSPRDRQKSR